jgi:hypothetical protein
VNAEKGWKIVLSVRPDQRVGVDIGVGDERSWMAPLIEPGGVDFEIRHDGQIIVRIERGQAFKLNEPELRALEAALNERDGGGPSR